MNPFEDIDAQLNSRPQNGHPSTTTPSVSYVNEAGLPDDVFARVKENTEIANAIEKWSQSLSGGGQRVSSDVFARDKWSMSTGTFAHMSQCAWAVENDDILSTLGDVIEGLTFKKTRFEMHDEDQQDVWNQWARDVDVDSRLREQFRELYKVSQLYVGLWWEKKIYSVRDSVVQQALDEVKTELDIKEAEALGQEPPSSGPGRGNRKRKKSYPVEIPTALTIFDPTKIMPVGQLMFGRERFAYIATKAEGEAFQDTFTGHNADPAVRKLIEGNTWVPSEMDKKACADVGVDDNNLWLMREDAIYRHTLTRAQYERFAPVRLKAILPILEMKAHLRASDRAALIGSTNFIVVITKGTDKLPARPAEIENLREQARLVARLPVLVGDHRLHVEIVAPKTDNTLIESRWQTLDSRLVFKALASFQPLVQGGAMNSGVKEMGAVIAGGLENRRLLLVRAIEAGIFAKVMARNVGVLDEMPHLAFAPKRITLDFSADIMNAILKLRDRGDVSRESTLDEFDYDQDVEVLRRAKEKVAYDEIFNSGTPYGSPALNPYGAEPVVAGEPQADAPATTPAKAVPAKAPVKTVAVPAKKVATKAAVKKAPPQGGRPVGAKDTKPRQAKGTVKA